MPFARWFIIIVAFWSTCSVWATDPLARGDHGSHRPLYWAIIAFICMIALVLEIRDVFKRPARRSEIE